MPGIFVKLAPHSRGILDPYKDSTIMGGGCEKRTTMPSGMSPGNLPYWTVVTFECCFLAMGTVAINLKDFDGTIG